LPFSTKLWKNNTAGGTKLNAAGLIDLEKRVTDYADLVGSQSSLVINAKTEGAKGDGSTDDTTALQKAIDAAIAAQLPLYLPPGEYKTTATLLADNSSPAPDSVFCMFGAGRKSRIVPSASTFDCLVVGPGIEGSGVSPSGYLRDFSIYGGNQEVKTAGIGKGNGTAALKLDGARFMDVANIDIKGKHDIALDMVHNCWGSTFKDCRLGFESARVGINIRTGPETGEDITFFDCWVSGEVAAVCMREGQGYRFIGGQYSASRQTEANEDGRGVFIFGRDYVAGTNHSSSDCDVQLWTSLEYFKRCWAIRGYGRVFLWARSNFNPSTGPALGFYKNSAHASSQIQLHSCHFHDNYGEATDEQMVTIEGGNSNSNWIEIGSHGTFTTKSGERNGLWETMGKLGKVSRKFGVRDGVILDMPGAQLKVESGALQISFDEGSTYRAVMGDDETLASANTMTVKATTSYVGVTGTTEIKKINATFAGHRIVLKFAAILTVADGENLKIATNFVTSADDTLDLVCDGTNWYEVGRSAN
jgi:hypothetical protein